MGSSNLILIFSEEYNTFIPYDYSKNIGFIGEKCIFFVSFSKLRVRVTKLDQFPEYLVEKVPQNCGICVSDSEVN